MLDDLFWNKVDKTSTCWLWKGAGGLCKGLGYGRVKRQGKMYCATHWSLYIATGKLPPKGSVVLHMCDNPRCVRPSHLKVGTQSENITDCVKKGRHASVPWLTADEVRKVREMRAAGLFYRQIGDFFGVSLHTIFQYCKGKHASFCND